MANWTLIERIGVGAGAVAGVAGVITMFGFSVDPPWAKADEMKDVKAQVQSVQQDVKNIGDEQKKQNDQQLKIQRVLLNAQLKEAQQDLRDNPNSISAARAVQDAKDAIAAIDQALAHP